MNFLIILKPKTVYPNCPFSYTKYDKEKQQISTSEKLQPANVWNFCLKNDCIYQQRLYGGWYHTLH